MNIVSTVYSIESRKSLRLAVSKLKTDTYASSRTGVVRSAD